MGAVLRYEWRRARTVRVTWVLLGVMVLLVAAVGTGSVLVISNGPPEPSGDPTGTARDLARIVTGTAPFLAVLQAVLGAQSLDHDYRFGTIRLTVQTFPDRARLLTAKAGSMFVMVGSSTLSIVGLVVVLGGVLDGRTDDLTDPTLWRVVLFGAVLGGLWAVIGLGLRVVLGSVALLAVMVILVPLVVENAVVLPVLDRVGLPADTIAPWLPGGSAHRALEWAPSGGPPPVVGLAAFAGWAVIVLLTSRVVFARRDVRPA